MFRQHRRTWFVLGHGLQVQELFIHKLQNGCLLVVSGGPDGFRFNGLFINTGLQIQDVYLIIVLYANIAPFFIILVFAKETTDGNQFS